MLYKITHNLDQSMYLVPQTTTITRNTSSLHYQIFSTLTDCYKHSVFPHSDTVELPNTLICVRRLSGPV